MPKRSQNHHTNCLWSYFSSNNFFRTKPKEYSSPLRPITNISTRGSVLQKETTNNNAHNIFFLGADIKSDIVEISS